MSGGESRHVNHLAVDRRLDLQREQFAVATTANPSTQPLVLPSLPAIGCRRRALLLHPLPHQPVVTGIFDDELLVHAGHVRRIAAACPENPVDSSAMAKKQHDHHWDRSCFIAGLEVRHCTKDCPAAQARSTQDDEWERIDDLGW